MIHINFTLTYLEIYFLVVSTFSFTLYAYDKLQACTNTQKASRISENKLLFSSFIGGTIGSLFCMFIVRHKIKKPSFIIKFSLVVITQLALIYLYVYQELIISETLNKYV
ncbi:MAG: DUF1294 domain-containing protein [Sulfurimonas sp.]|nr:DUF1294 domain-containing protein [Sulfurimonas sp.]